MSVMGFLLLGYVALLAAFLAACLLGPVDGEPEGSGPDRPAGSNAVFEAAAVVVASIAAEMAWQDDWTL